MEYFMGLVMISIGFILGTIINVLFNRYIDLRERYDNLVRILGRKVGVNT